MTRATIMKALPVRRRPDAVTLLTVYLFLLLVIPSNARFTALGSIGRPSVLWGVVLLVFWALFRLQQTQRIGQAPWNPLRTFWGALIALALVSFSAAMLRGQPPDQVSPAVTAIVRLLSWSGVILVAIDGIRTPIALFRLVRRLVVGATYLAAFGVVQLVTGQTLVDYVSIIPGFSLSAESGLAERSGRIRVTGTAYHPLEYTTTLNALLPLVIATAVCAGFWSNSRRARFSWWIPVGLTSFSSLVGVSRSATIGFVVVAILMIFGLPSRYRLWSILGGGIFVLAILVASPGLLSSTLGLFVGASEDPSTQSRFSGLEKAAEFISASPAIGLGFGTFLPRYYIFDNQWILLTVELGLAGLVLLAGLVVLSVALSIMGRSRFADERLRLVGYSLAVSVAVISLLFAFFDGLAFTISAGIFSLLVGMSGAYWSISKMVPIEDQDPLASNERDRAMPAREARLDAVD